MPGPAPDPTVPDRLLDAADARLARHGFAAMTVASVAAEAGVGKGSVYLHFPSKEALALACIGRMAARVLVALRRLAGARTPAPRRLRAMLAARVLMRFDYARGHAASLDELLGAVRPALLEDRRAQFAAEAEVFAAVLADGVREGTLRRAGALSAEALVTATNALLPYDLSAADLGRRAALERRVESLTDLLLHGLTVAPSRSGPRAAPTRRSR